MTPSHCKIKCVGCFLWFFCQPSSNESRHSPSWRGRSCLCSGIGPRHPVLPAAHSLTCLGQKYLLTVSQVRSTYTKTFWCPWLCCFGLLPVYGSCALLIYVSCCGPPMKATWTRSPYSTVSSSWQNDQRWDWGFVTSSSTHKFQFCNFGVLYFFWPKWDWGTT